MRRIAGDVARQQDPPLEVLGTTPAEGGNNYTEVILTITGCTTEPCRVVIGVRRDASEGEFRAAVADRLRHHLDEHRAARR